MVQDCRVAPPRDPHAPCNGFPADKASARSAGGPYDVAAKDQRAEPPPPQPQTHHHHHPSSSSSSAFDAAALRSLSYDLPAPRPAADDAKPTALAFVTQGIAATTLQQQQQQQQQRRQRLPDGPPHDDDDDQDDLPMPEPFKIKMVERIARLPRAQRRARLQQTGFNVFGLRSDEVFIDLLTDSGTSAMSDVQWANMMNTPQAYAGGSSFYALESVVQGLFGFKHVLPMHQGRAAENVLFSTLVTPRPGCYVPNNTHFDTTEANVLRCGGHPVNLATPEAYDTAAPLPFKGNMDLAALEEFLEEHGGAGVPLVMITITNNSAGGQPVSMDNVRQVSRLARRHGVPLFVDAARFAENAWFIQRWEPGYSGKPLADIVRELFSYADGCTFSGKKEALANVGGLLCCNDDALYEKLRNLAIVVEGFTSYGGLACRDLMAMARGLVEVVDQAYQDYRHGQVELLAGLLRDAGVPIVEPPGGHAVYVDAARFLPHVPPRQFPAQALTAALYEESGVRGVEIGSSCFGTTDPATGAFTPARLELMRLAIPRRVYSHDHLRYVAAALGRLWRARDAVAGLRRVYAAPLLSHFTAKFERLPAPGPAPAPAGDAA